MAYGDYQHCAVCDAKTFYDAGIDWTSQHVATEDGAPTSVKSLCDDCAETHEIVVRARAVACSEATAKPTPTSVPGGGRLR